jgi:hypothetical protein
LALALALALEEPAPDGVAADPGFPEDGVPVTRDGAVTAGVAEVPLASEESAPECETARKMATPATTPMAAPKAIRRGPRPARRVKRPPNVVDLPTCPTPVPLSRSGIPLVNPYKTYRARYSNCGIPRACHAQWRPDEEI